MKGAPSGTLGEQRDAFRQRRFLAMPLAGAFAWILIGVSGAALPMSAAVWALFILSGSIVYLGIFISRFTGEDFLAKGRPKNTFDSLFFIGTLQALLVYSIAIPFFLQDPSSLPLTVGILTGLMWTPLSWMIQHWIGVFHAVSRTVLVLACWYVFPLHRFVVIPAIIVVLYLVTILVLERRWRVLQKVD